MLFLPGITADYLVYTIIIPIMPFHLEALGYSEISALVGYLLFAYVRIDRPFFRRYSPIWLSFRHLVKWPSIMYEIHHLGGS